MESQEKSFRDLQKDERLKKLERHLKLTQIKRPISSQLAPLSHMSISSISSIHGDNPSSDFSFTTPSVTSSRAGSVIIASSNNLRKRLSKNSKVVLKPGPITSSVFNQSLESRKQDEDRVMMPPPPAVNTHKPQPLVNSEQKVQAVNSTPKSLLPQHYENQTRNSHFPHEASGSNCNTAVHSEATKEVSRSSDTSKQYGRVFKNWIVRLNDHGQVIIRGRLESGEQARSKPVKKRLSANMVLSILKHKYHLVGDIHDVREELPEYVRGKFYNGFPVDWENVRQIWQGYVASGFSLSFRWPRPMADSDDDLRSDITDLTVARLKNTRVKPTSFLSTSRTSQTVREIDRSSSQRETRSQRKKVTNDSDISSIYSAVNEASDARAKITAVETSRTQTVERLSPGLDNRSANQSGSPSKNVQPKNTESSNFGNIVQRWKVDVIIDNLMNKNCSKEYIEKIIKAIDCFNELLTTPSTENGETAIDEGVSLNYNSNYQTDTTSNKIYNDKENMQVLQNGNSSRPQHSRQTAITPSSSYSVESSEQSEEELQSGHKTFLCQQTLLSGKNNPAGHTSTKSQQSRTSGYEPENFSNLSDVNGEQNRLTPAGLTSPKYDISHMKNKENQVTAALPRKEIIGQSTQSERYKRKAIFDSADSDLEGPVSNKPRTASTHNSSIDNTSSRRTPGSEYQSTAVEKKKNGIAGSPSDNVCDSDVSIVDTRSAPVVKAKILSIQNVTDGLGKRNHHRETLRSDFSFASTEKNDHSKANSPIPKRSGNLSNEKTLGSSSVKVVDQCTGRLNKVPVDQHNRNKSKCTPSKTEKIVTRHQKNRIDTEHQMTEQPGSDSENVSMRMSSRGRRILPPLDYWNGERVILKGRELIYSPGTSRVASLSVNSSILKHTLSPNTTAVSEPMPVSGFSKNLKNTPTGPTDRSKSTVESTNKNPRRIGGILSEISANHDEDSDHETMCDRRVTRTSVNNIQKNLKKTSRRSRNMNPKSDTSSDDEKLRLVGKRKKRRIY